MSRNHDIKNRKLDLNLLAVFDAVYVTGSVTKAAAMLNLSPPSISQSLHKLKDHFGDPLFLRDGQKLCVTTLATKLHNKVKHHFVGLKIDIDDFEHEKFRNELVIQCSPYLSLRVIPLITSFYESQDLKCIIKHKNNDGVSNSEGESLAFRQVDLVFGYNNDLGMSVNSVKTGNDEFVFICRQNHPRIDTHLSKENVLGEKFARLNTDATIARYEREKLEHSLSMQEFSFETDSLFSMAAHVETTDSLALVPLWFFAKFKSSFNIKKLNSMLYTPRADFYMSYSKYNVDRVSYGFLHDYLKEKICCH